MTVELSRAEAYLNTVKPNPEKALKVLRPVLKKGRANWLAYHYCGIAELMRGEHSKAAEFFRRSVKAGSEEPETFHSLSVAYFHLGQLDEALEQAKKALSLNPEFFKGWLHIGSVYRDKAMLDDALKCYQKANQLDPKSASVAFRIGVIYADQGDLNKALELFDITLKLDTEYEEAVIRKGILLQKLRKFSESEACFRSLIKKQSNHLGANIGLAELYKAMGDYQRAVDLYEQIISDYPHMTSVLVNYALCLQELGRFDESEKNYMKAFRDKPDLFQSFSNYLMALHYNPNRTREEIFKEHLKWDELFAGQPEDGRPVPEDQDPDRKLRLGFISGGFRRHPVGWMILKALENLPKKDFEIYCYTTNNIVDSNTQRIHAVSESWRSVIGYSDEVTAKIIRDDKIDILIELSGHSEDNRLKMISMEPAPVVLKWVGGLFNTTGLSSVDYLLTDWYETPEGEEPYYTEKLVRMPDDYICYEKPEYTPEVGPLPVKDQGYITFGCFNNPTKINDEILSKWAEILKSVPDSRLFLKSKQYGAELFTERIVEKMKEWGVAPGRLMFEGEATHDKLLNSYNKVDIALDPWPYSGGLSTIEALMMGVPVISLPGPTFAGRHAASHLINAGLGEFVCDSWDEYKQLAIDLAGNVERLEEIRSGLRDQLENSPVFDGPRFAAHFSSALRSMWKQRVNGYKENKKEGQWQDHINVEPISETQIERKEIKVIETVRGTEVSPNIVGSHGKPIRGKGGIRYSLPEDLNTLTTYVFKEQKKWIDPEVDLLSELLDEGATAIDIGAGFGAFSLPLAKVVGDTGKVFAFEPNADCVKHLQLSKEINEAEVLEIIQKAVSDQDSDLKFDAGMIPEMGRLLPSGEEMVPVVTQDTFFNEGKVIQPDLIKIDVNGDELRVLKGAGKLLNAHTPILLVANHQQKQNEQIAEELNNYGYRYFEYIPGMHVMSEFDPGQPSVAANFIGLTEQHISALTKKGLIYQSHASIAEPDQDVWMPYILSQPWAKELSGEWTSSTTDHQREVYLRILDYICEAERRLSIAAKEPSKNYPDVTNMLLTAASTLIEIYNGNPSNVPVSFTLSRVLNRLGRRDQAAAILKNTMEELMVNKKVPDLTLPFLLPLKMQDVHEIRTDCHSWLKVKALESWLLLKEVTTYFLGDKERSLLKGLQGNPEVLPLVDHIGTEVINEDSAPSSEQKKQKFVHIAFNHVYAKCLSDLVEYTNANSDQEHRLYVNVHKAIEKYNADIGDNEFSLWFDAQKHLKLIIDRCLEEEVEAVFFHGLFFPWQHEIIKAISEQKHIGWIIWGGDLYKPIQNGKPIHEVVDLIHSIHSIIDGDIRVFENTYGKRPHYSFGYTYPGLYGELPDLSSVNKKKQIIVGNSGDASNNHIEILKTLSAKKDIGDYELLIPASYNLSAEYEVILGRAIQSFGLKKNARLLKEFLSPEQYFALISSSQMLITAHHRQQAVGNILTSLFSGNSTFLRKDIEVNGKEQRNPTWDFLEAHGLKGCDYRRLENATTIKGLLGEGMESSEAQQIIREQFGLERRSTQLIESCRVIAGDNVIQPKETPVV